MWAYTACVVVIVAELVVGTILTNPIGMYTADQETA